MNRAMRGWLTDLQKWFGEKLDLIKVGNAGDIVLVGSGGTLRTSRKNLPTGQVVGDTDAQTLTSKTIVSATISGGTINGGAISGGTIVEADLTDPSIVAFYQSPDRDKQISVPEPENATETMALTDTAQRLLKKDILLYQSEHDYDGGTDDWTLSTAENSTTWLKGTNAGGAVNAIATPTLGKVFTVTNATGYVLTILADGATGVAIANGKTADVIGDGTDFIRRTPDA